MTDKILTTDKTISRMMHSKMIIRRTAISRPIIRITPQMYSIRRLLSRTLLQVPTAVRLPALCLVFWVFPDAAAMVL